MECRRIVLRVLIWRHSARQHHLVLRGFSSPLVSSRPRQSPGFNIKPSLIWSSRSPSHHRHPFSQFLPVSVSAMADSRWIFCHYSDVLSILAKPDMHNRTRKEKVTFMKTQRFLEDILLYIDVFNNIIMYSLNKVTCINVSLCKII